MKKVGIVVLVVVLAVILIGAVAVVSLVKMIKEKNEKYYEYSDPVGVIETKYTAMGQEREDEFQVSAVHGLFPFSFAAFTSGRS